MTIHYLHACNVVHYFPAFMFTKQVKLLLICFFLCQKSGKFTSCLCYCFLCPYPSGGLEDVPSVGLLS